jgi:hypothetical protein
MGARVTYVFSEGEDKPAICLYSHWGADTWEKDLAGALRHAKSRLALNDYSYAVRNIISFLTQDNVLDETGFGIYAVASPLADIADGWYDLTIFVDLVNKQVHGHSFDSFTQFHLGKEKVNA